MIFLQLPVLDDEGRAIGIVSWESVAKLVLRGEDLKLESCIERVEELRLEDDLLRSLPTIIVSGSVVVVDSDRVVSGIITTADLSAEFESIASPFLLVGECERHLRRIISDRFSVDELRGHSRYGRKDTFLGAESMSLGDYNSLLIAEGNWERLHWDLDRNQFLTWLDEVRQLRNEIAHFSADGVDRDHLEMVRNLTKWLRASK